MQLDSGHARGRVDELANVRIYPGLAVIVVAAIAVAGGMVILLIPDGLEERLQRTPAHVFLLLDVEDPNLESKRSQRLRYRTRKNESVLHPTTLCTM